MSTTIKTNLNSSSNRCSLAALKNHITTCLQRWRKKSPDIKSNTNENERNRHQEKKCYCHFQQNSIRWFGKHCTTIFQKIPPRQRSNRNNDTTNCNDSKGPRQYGRKVEIVAKLLSTTLIAKAKTSTEDFCQQTDEQIYRCFEKQIKVLQNTASSSTSEFYSDDRMTITDLTFMELREEYPDINSEIRSILTARAQDGATISEIRDDYRKLTGLTFPIYQDVTEFLLTIPHVTAYCTEKGTRVFNIRPMEKTKHIHNMVMQQKSQPETLQRPASKPYYRERQSNSNYQPSTWRRNTCRLSRNNAHFYVEPINVRNMEPQEQLPSTDISKEGSEVFFENNCYYQDNCNYLFNRICNQQEPLPSQLIEPTPQTLLKPAPLPPSNVGTSTDLKNYNSHIPSYKNNINHLNTLFQLQNQQQRQYQQDANNLEIIDPKRSALNPYKTGFPRSSRSSSPTAKSWYTNESAFTDSDYEAHLLDFLLLGDDFFLYMARMELRCKFKKNQRILQSGLCVSGQTIGASIKRIRTMSDQRRSVILNIGSVDIMQGRQLIQIEHEFRELLLTMLKKGINPILTTLAPLANYSHNNDVKRLLERFNEFIKREGQKRNLVVIDIWKCLVNEKGHVFFDCYQNEPRNVTGTSESYLFWNKIGRQRVLQLIESKLEY